MPKRLMFTFFVGLLLEAASDSRRAQAEPAVPAAKIATGKALWVESMPDNPLLNVRVDIGSMRQVGEELEGVLRWPVTPATPYVTVETTRVSCGPAAELYYSVAVTKESPDGKVLERRTYNPAEERKKAETSAWRPTSYSPHSRSLLCWAAARKCEGKPFTWPPPPNLTPLEYSERATQMQAAYNQLFVPKCKLTERK